MKVCPIEQIQQYIILGNSPKMYEVKDTSYQLVNGKFLIDGEEASIYSHSRYQSLQAFVSKKESTNLTIVIEDTNCKDKK